MPAPARTTLDTMIDAACADKGNLYTMPDLEGFDAEEIEEEILRPEETVVDRPTTPDGELKVRQAGTAQESTHKDKIRLACERSLYVFVRTIFRFDFLHPPLHTWLAEKIQSTPPFRKGIIIPRWHGKTLFGTQGLSMHALIQPRHGLYLHDERRGTDTRIMIACEAFKMAAKRSRWILSQFESNDLLRALWPHAVWENPKKQSKKWNPEELIIPREIDFPDPTIQSLGVDSAITGGRCDILIKDDLATEKAANSTSVMLQAIEFHELSRALLHSKESLELLIGTIWGPEDLYVHAMKTDPSIEWHVRSVVEPDPTDATKPEVCIWPSKVEEMGGVEQLKKELGTWFPLIMMNKPSSREHVDFPEDQFRYFKLRGQGGTAVIEFEEDARDAFVRKLLSQPKALPPGFIGRDLSDAFDELSRESGLREYLSVSVG